MSAIEIIENFEGASIGKYHIRGDKIFATLREEPLVKKDGIVHDYNWHFVFGLRNNSKHSKEIEIFINCDKKNNLQYKSYILGQQNADLDFYPLTNIEAYTDTFKKYYIKVVLLEKETLYISNTFFRSLKLLYNTFGNLSKNLYCTKEPYGKSFEGRDLLGYVYSDGEISNNYKPAFVITSGFHPMEADTFATEAIMENLNTNEGKSLLKYFNFIIIPIVNPDGFSYGYNGCNVKGINLYWDFKEKDKTNAPEAYYLWRYFLKMQPSIYLDFHSYTFQLHRKKASPYIKPLFFYRGEEVKNLVNTINKELISLHNGNYLSGDLTYAPSTLSYKLTNKFNTITNAKYHLHIMDGKEKFKNKAVNIVKKISQQIIAQDFHDKNKILAYPYGQVRSNIKDIIRRKLRILWIFKIKVLIKRILFKI